MRFASIKRICFMCLCFFSAVSICNAGKYSEIVIRDATVDSNGFLVHTVDSPFQSGKTKIRVLLPSQIHKDKKYRVLFVLPVEKNEENRYGDGLLEIKKANLHNKHNLICVAPTFSHLPWYANHPSDQSIQQETYFLKVVVSFVDVIYPTTCSADGRFLLGFSKSGWGAFSLLLRNPDLFSKAAAWDAPLMKQKPDQFGMGPIFGTQDNFNNYKITSLLEQNASKFGDTNRLILTGYGNFQKHHLQFRKFTEGISVHCIYRNGPKRKHLWSTGWLPETVELLVSK